jgi:hypothetical protein
MKLTNYSCVVVAVVVMGCGGSMEDEVSGGPPDSAMGTPEEHLENSPAEFVRLVEEEDTRETEFAGQLEGATTDEAGLRDMSSPQTREIDAPRSLVVTDQNGTEPTSDEASAVTPASHPNTCLAFASLYESDEDGNPVFALFEMRCTARTAKIVLSGRFYRSHGPRFKVDKTCPDTDHCSERTPLYHNPAGTQTWKVRVRYGHKNHRHSALQSTTIRRDWLY